MDQFSKDERIFTSAFALITTNFTYDLGCNMTSDGRFTYYWNGENRLICASNAETVVTYAYDYRGRMVQKNISHGDTEPQRIEYLWDNWNIIRETLTTNHYSLTTVYVWGLDGTLQGAGGVGGLLAVIQANSPTPNSTTYQLYLPTCDANGNITEYVATNGDIVAHYEYSAFGEPVVTSGELAASFTHQFSTKPYCAVTGFNEYQMRKYRPVIGRWMSRDPMAEKGAVNVFLACRNNFFIFYDALGYCPLTIIVGSLPNDATPDAGGWFSANPPEITINGKSCPKDQHGWILDRTACSATIWLLQDTPFARDHEMSHYSCLQQYKSQLDSYKTII